MGLPTWRSRQCPSAVPVKGLWAWSGVNSNASALSSLHLLLLLLLLGDEITGPYPNVRPTLSVQAASVVNPRTPSCTNPDPCAWSIMFHQPVVAGSPKWSSALPLPAWPSTKWLLFGRHYFQVHFFLEESAFLTTILPGLLMMAQLAPGYHCVQIITWRQIQLNGQIL